MKTNTIEIVYIKGFQFGELYCNPKTREGVAVPDQNSGKSPINIIIKEDYNPYEDPDAVKFNVKEPVFKKLYEAASNRDSNLVNKILTEDFKKYKHKNYSLKPKKT